MINIIELSQVNRKYQVTYDSEKEATFHIPMPAKIMKFSQTLEGLYLIEIDKNYKKQKMNQQQKCSVISIKDNKSYHSPRQISRAKQTKDLHHSLGAPSAKDLKAMIFQKLSKNNPVVIKDVDLAIELFGMDICIYKREINRKYSDK